MCQGQFPQLFPQLRRKRPCLRKNKENDRLPAVMRICYLPRENAGTVLSSCFGHTTGAIGTVLGAFRQSEASGLSIWRKPTRPASSRSKAVDSTAAHRFQTVRCNGDAKLVPLGPRIPGFHKPDRFYCYGSDCPMKFHRFYCNLKRKDGHA